MKKNNPPNNADNSVNQEDDIFVKAVPEAVPPTTPDKKTPNHSDSHKIKLEAESAPEAETADSKPEAESVPEAEATYSKPEAEGVPEAEATDDDEISELQLSDKVADGIVRFFSRVSAGIAPLKDFVSIFAFVAAVLVVLYYIVFPSRGAVTSDTADTIFWAFASSESNSLFNTDFSYPCLLPFGGQLIMIPLVKLFGLTMKAQIIGMVIFAILFISALLYMLKAFGWNRCDRLFTATALLAIASASPKLREIFWEHIIYYSLGLFFAFIGLGMIFKIVRYSESDDINLRKKTVILVLLTFIWCLLTATNRIETLTLYLAPALGALILERFFNIEKTRSFASVASAALIGVFAIGTAAGYYLGGVLTDGLVAGYEGAFSNFSDESAWIGNAEAFIHHWFTLLGASSEGLAILSIKGITLLLLVLVGMILLISPIFLIVVYPKLKSRCERIYTIFHLLMSLLLMMAFILGKLSNANWRLSPMLCSSVIATAILIKYIRENAVLKRGRIVLTAPIAVFSAIVLINTGMISPDNGQNRGLYAVMKDLKGLGLDYGYATFWQANAITLISDDTIRVRNIMYSDDYTSYEIYYYMSSWSWYADQPNQDKYFVLLNASEYYSNKALETALYISADEIHSISEGYYVFVYNQNIFA